MGGKTSKEDPNPETDSLIEKPKVIQVKSKLTKKTKFLSKKKRKVKPKLNTTNTTQFHQVYK